MLKETWLPSLGDVIWSRELLDRSEDDDVGWWALLEKTLLHRILFSLQIDDRRCQGDNEKMDRPRDGCCIMER